MDGRPNRRNKAAFLFFSGVVWTEPKHMHSGQILTGLICKSILEPHGSSSQHSAYKESLSTSSVSNTRVKISLMKHIHVLLHPDIPNISPSAEVVVWLTSGEQTKLVYSLSLTIKRHKNA